MESLAGRGVANAIIICISFYEHFIAIILLRPVGMFLEKCGLFSRKYFFLAWLAASDSLGWNQVLGSEITIGTVCLFNLCIVGEEPTL